MRYAAIIASTLLFTSGNVWLAHAADYDGTWRYDLTTDSANPVCQGFITGKIAIKDNKISGNIGHNRDNFRVRGQIEGDTGTFTAAGSYDSAQFTVTFADNNGTGTWTARVAGCDGVISLTR